LHGTPISDSGLTEVGKLSRLTVLFLNSCRNLTDDGVEHLTKLTHLQHLELEKTPLTDATLRHLKQMQSLRILDIIGTQITAAGAAELQAALPKCVVFHESLMDTPWRMPAVAE
jgi:hypothetical protein